MPCTGDSITQPESPGPTRAKGITKPSPRHKLTPSASSASEQSIRRQNLHNPSGHVCKSNPGSRVRQHEKHENTNAIQVTCLILDAQRIRTFPTTAAPGTPGIHRGCGMALDRHVETEV
ncbi:hypothetical protein N7530_007071 [Penicillium desertorum]|uniref:Uncharacterized protein n=1 Tax=Penicillium desertorum TaxID=1303715 RepID=A0A9W9WSY2_9EURO|nr:hypothetical protein N7530_007071 [Penicillium desertorum]